MQLFHDQSEKKTHLVRGDVAAQSYLYTYV